MNALAEQPKVSLAPNVADFCRRAVEALRAKLPVREVWLFGSQAEGRANEHSDFDFFVVLADGHGIYRPNLACYTAIREAVDSEPIDVVSLTETRWREEQAKQRGIYYGDVATTGVRIV